MMDTCRRFTFRYPVILLCLAFLFPENSIAQPVVGLDVYFNHEINISTGKQYHYVWSDTSMSGFSSWGDLFTSSGASLKSIGKPVPAVLKDIDVYIIVDPDTTTESQSPEYILPDDISAVKRWTDRGGVLVIMANDAPNCEFTHLNKLASCFGIKFNHVTLNRVINDDFETGAITDLPSVPLFNGVKKIFMKDVSDISLSGNAQAVLSVNGKIFIAEARFGKGYVFAAGDPWIYNEYIDHARLPADFDNLKAARNLTHILLGHARTKRN